MEKYKEIFEKLQGFRFTENGILLNDGPNGKAIEWMDMQSYYVGEKMMFNELMSALLIQSLDIDIYDCWHIESNGDIVPFTDRYDSGYLVLPYSVFKRYAERRMNLIPLVINVGTSYECVILSDIERDGFYDISEGMYVGNLGVGRDISQAMNLIGLRVVQIANGCEFCYKDYPFETFGYKSRKDLCSRNVYDVTDISAVVDGVLKTYSDFPVYRYEKWIYINPILASKLFSIVDPVNVKYIHSDETIHDYPEDGEYRKNMIISFDSMISLIYPFGLTALYSDGKPGNKETCYRCSLYSKKPMTGFEPIQDCFLYKKESKAVCKTEDEAVNICTLMIINTLINEKKDGRI